MRHTILFRFFIFLFLLLFIPKVIFASSLSLSPSTSNLKVGSTFDVNVLLDTQGRSINAMQIFLSFPPNLLEVISPSFGSSVVNLWTASPKFDNNLGTVELEGGIPNGIITSGGVITTVKFRVKSAGTAEVYFFNNSQIFRNDGLATPDLQQKNGAIYKISALTPVKPITPPIVKEVVKETPKETPVVVVPEPVLPVEIEKEIEEIPEKVVEEVVIEDVEKVPFYAPFLKLINEFWLDLEDLIITSGNFIWITVAFLIAILGFLSYKVAHWHGRVHIQHSQNLLPPEIVAKLEDLQSYRDKYGTKMLVFLACLLSFVPFHKINAEGLYFDSSTVGNFLQSGQNWINDNLNFSDSNLTNVFAKIDNTASVIVGQNFDYDKLFINLSIILFLIIFGLLIFIFFHVYHGRRKHKELQESLRSVKKAMYIEFNLLRRDMENRLAEIQKMRNHKTLSQEEIGLEIELLKDLASIAKHTSDNIHGLDESLS